jgi:hypothetical protein
MSTKKQLFILFSLIILAACSSFPKHNQDPNKDNPMVFNKELKECQEEYPATNSGLYVRQWEGCMMLKG